MDEPSTTVAFDGSQPARDVGRYSYVVATDSWTWSDGLYAMHGYSPREVPATTEVLLSHKHPDDRARAFGVLEQASRDGEAFSCYHRIIDRNLQVRSVLSVGHGIMDATDKVERVEGFFIDLTEVRRDETQAEVTATLQRMATNRETIDLAKGMLMLGQGCTADAAFQVLRRCSQNANLKLHDVAGRLVEAVGAGAADGDDLTGFLDGLTDDSGT